MKVHEYQAKEILAVHGVPVTKGKVASTLDEAKKVYASLGVAKVAVKAQVHAGGRGKAGGIKVASNAAECEAAAKAILGMKLVSPQTGPEGKIVQKVLIEEAVEIKKEFYAAVTLDRATRRPVVIASLEGGVEIEEVAAKTPEKIVKALGDPRAGVRPFEARAVAFRLGGIDGKTALGIAKVIHGLSRVFMEKHASMAEVNPVALLSDGRVVAADAKINFDDSALFLHPEIEAMRDESEEDPEECRARKADLSFVNLDGSIGCMVNGAGLAMATMDFVKFFGASPANFLDIGGGAKRERVAEALRIILSSPEVKGIFINIFGGIVRCDEVARGILAAKEDVGIKVPLVVRLKGTNDEEGRRILQEGGITALTDLDEAAKKAAAMATKS